MELSNLQPAAGSKHSDNFRRGRGHGSGNGKTAGKMCIRDRPKRVKRRKQFRGSMAGKALRGNTISNGEYGLVATEPCWIKSNQIEAARVAMTRYIKRSGKVWIKIFPDKPVTAKDVYKRQDAEKFFCTGIVGNLKSCFLLNHTC